MFFNILLSAALGATFVNAHGTITEIQGANGQTAPGFGILASTPRNCAQPNPCEQDTSVIRQNAIASGKTGPCGSTKAGGNNDVTTQLAAASSAGLPTCSSSGAITMTLHQVNQDGAGPYSCDVSGDGGNTFQAATVTKNVPGFLGLSASAAKDFPIEVQMPAGASCAGGPDGNACIVRCKNQAAAGPFGGCAAFTTPAQDAAAPAAAAGNATAAKAPAAAPAQAAAAPAQAAGGAGAGGGLGGILGAFTGGAGGADAAGGAGGLGGILGAFGGAGKNKKRVVLSRVAGEKAGYWI